MAVPELCLKSRSLSKRRKRPQQHTRVWPHRFGRTKQWRLTMETVLFTDHSIVVFAVTTSAIALMLSVLGLATTRRTRTDIEHQFRH